jgi:hypothetical protein
MAKVTLVGRLSARIDELEAEIAPPVIYLASTLGEAPELRAASARGYDVRFIECQIVDPLDNTVFIYTGVHRRPDPACCTRESVAAALPDAKRNIAEQAKFAGTAMDRANNGMFSELESIWRELCGRFDVPYDPSQLGPGG